MSDWIQLVDGTPVMKGFVYTNRPTLRLYQEIQNTAIPNAQRQRQKEVSFVDHLDTALQQATL